MMLELLNLLGENTHPFELVGQFRDQLLHASRRNVSEFFLKAAFARRYADRQLSLRQVHKVVAHLPEFSEPVAEQHQLRRKGCHFGLGSFEGRMGASLRFVHFGVAHTQFQITRLEVA